MACTLRKGFLAVLLAALAVIGHSLQAATFPDKPPKEHFFVDEAKLLDEQARKAIDATALALLKDERIPLFVVTIPSLSAYEASGLGIEAYAKALFDAWGIGSADRNYGMLLLVSAGDRKARIELGAGFEHRYDAQADDIMQSLIVPAFRRGEYSTGIGDGVRGLDAMAQGAATSQADGALVVLAGADRWRHLPWRPDLQPVQEWQVRVGLGIDRRLGGAHLLPAARGRCRRIRRGLRRRILGRRRSDRLVVGTRG